MLSRTSHAERLRRLRELLDFSQRDLAAELDVAKSAVAMWEAEERDVPGPVLRLLDLYEAELGLVPASEGRLQLRTSWLGRSAKLSSSAAGLAATGLAGALQQALGGDADAIKLRTRAALARRLVRTLGGLKGLAMKAGQMLSYLPFAASEELRAELEVLQTKSEPMAAAEVAEIFVAEVGKTPRQLFAEWSPRPMASASIGQVHRARLHSGEHVAIKVQYPGIEKAIRSDLKNSALIEQLGLLLFRGQERGVIVNELSAALLEECDYTHEAANQELFRAAFADYRAVLVPRVYRELSSRRILVTELVRGRGFAEFVASASQAERNRAGETIHHFAFTSLFRHRLFNADPHPGNYVFSGDRVAILDYGCVKRFSSGFIDSWRQLFQAGLRDDVAESVRLMKELHITRGEGLDLDYGRRAFAVLFEPWRSDAPYRFSDEYVRRTWQETVVDNPSKFSMNVPKDALFLNRLHWGVCAVLAALGAEAQWRRALTPLLEPATPAQSFSSEPDTRSGGGTVR